MTPEHVLKLLTQLTERNLMPAKKAKAVAKKPVVMGWCMTNQHEECRFSYESQGKTRVCPCDCHTGKE
jgi:hypothetical protein